MKIFFRFTFYLLLNFLYIIFRPIIHRHKLIDFITLVYPGTDRDIKSYVLFKWIRAFLPIISVVGVFIYRNGKKFRLGLTVATGYSAEEMEKNKILLLQIRSSLLKFAENIGVKSVAMVGRMPSIMVKMGIPIEPPLLSGNKGTLFALTETIKDVLQKEKLFPEEIVIGILGVGYIGRTLFECLKKMKFAGIRAVDVRFKVSVWNKNRIKLGNDPKLLEECNVVVVLTPRGSDLKKYLPYLRNGVIIIDDTHPKIPKNLLGDLIRLKKAKIYKVLLTLKKMKIFPSWPGYSNYSLPGCTIEAIVTSINRNIPFSSQISFTEAARKIGLQTLLKNKT